MKRPSGRPHWGSPRALRVEPLEQRELLSVTVGPQTWKDFDFTSTGVVSGKMTTPQEYNGRTYNVSVTLYHDPTLPGAEFDGKLVYTSANQGTFEPTDPLIPSMTGEDGWKINIPGYYSETGTWTLNDGSVESITDAGGKLTGSVYLGDFTTSGGLDSSGSYPVSGTFSPSNLSLSASFSIKQPELWGSFTYKGTMTPTDQDAFDINLGQPLAWGAGNSVTFDVEIDGPVHTAKSETTPFTDVQVFWANGTNLANRISKTPLTLDTAKGSLNNDGIPLYWNQASGHYTISSFLPAKIPATATNLLFVTKFTDSQGKVQEKVLGTLALPTVSIAQTTVDEPAQGVTTPAQYAVTYTVPEGFTPLNSNPVTVAWQTKAGTATAKKDYTTTTGLTTTTGALTFSANVSGSQTITVPILGDASYEPDETFKISAKVQNASIAGDAVETIHDLTLPKVKINDVTSYEGIRGTVNYVFAVELTNASSQWIKVDYTLQDGSTVNFDGNPWTLTASQIATAGQDYVSPSGQPKTLTFGPGKKSLTITVVVKGDTVVEETEYFSVILSNARTQGGVVVPITEKAGVGVGEIDNGKWAVRAAGVASRDAAFGQIAGPAALAAYFDQLKQEKTDQSSQAAGLTLKAM